MNTLRTPNGQVPPHGTPSRYNHHGCRCDACERARRRDTKSREMGRQRLVWSAPTARRLQALAWQGWGVREVAERIDVPYVTVYAWREEQYPRIWAEGAARVAVVYEQLWNAPPPRGSRAASVARRKGWRSPMDWEGRLHDRTVHWQLRPRRTEE